MTGAVRLTELNEACFCLPIDRRAVEQAVCDLSRIPDMPSLLASRENYFAGTAVFVSPEDLKDMKAQISAIEDTTDLAPYQQAVWHRGGALTDQVQMNTRGVFMGYDFHLTPEGPRLIEVNSNAGGAFIVQAMEHAIGRSDQATENLIADMFATEWQKAGRVERLRRIAIVDDLPEQQYHYPDMCLAAEALKRHGYDVVVTSSAHIQFEDQRLHINGQVIDLVYNRLTDFDLREPENKPLREAFLADAAVVTPNPRHHALYADKRNLALLSRQDLLVEWGVPDETCAILSRIPKTVLVTPENADQLWRDRKKYFFKPFAGFGSRGTYRGAKVTKKVWAHIISAGYVAQEFVAPSHRAVTRSDDKVTLKFDMRVYTYDGKPLLLAARVYQGQTTNMRTAGGGLAPVLRLEMADANCAS